MRQVEPGGERHFEHGLVLADAQGSSVGLDTYAVLVTETSGRQPARLRSGVRAGNRQFGYSHRMRIDFVKMHGAGNDFIVFDVPAGASLPTVEQWRQLSDRHTGVGFDQALVLEPPRRPDTAVFYRIFNADGIEVEQCGNGARCIAAHVHRRGRVSSDVFTMDSPAGLIQVKVLGPTLVSVDMGVPNFAPASLPFDASSEAHVYPLEVAGTQVEIGAVSMGNTGLRALQNVAILIDQHRARQVARGRACGEQLGTPGDPDRTVAGHRRCHWPSPKYRH